MENDLDFLDEKDRQEIQRLKSGILSLAREGKFSMIPICFCICLAELLAGACGELDFSPEEFKRFMDNISLQYKQDCE